ncbi:MULTISPECIES: aspartate ammonia-lyase [Arthrobacter]|uniref:Aspartate ammonia-lyase n=1 Tax=Arthrobacter terricola TaxID=2547396 RepID=A0A4R5K8K7_9MICC|nr:MULTISPECIES: aspartate ammonia-lyase [Arthrobacter]MBT8163132.1 aspartate ammonia-lyase [Arthrobacter sp. GN70]TDF91296.1 aspartate ammonia-lyase [Arthrobacter terricola]
MNEQQPEPTRIEADLLGMREIPAEAYWGVHTLRARENFRIAGETVGDTPGLVAAIAAVKEAAAEANMELGLLDRRVGQAISAACRDLRSGLFGDQFPIPLIQGGAGTSTNMNANEVIANRALEHLGEAKGSYRVVSPNEHVNLGQSTNDVYPTALKVATISNLRSLIGGLEKLQTSCETKAREFDHIVKMGRTQLQDAVPMTLGQEFRSFAVTIGEDIARLTEAITHLHEINLGATAIGTGLNTHPVFASIVREKLEHITGLPVKTSPDLVEATQDCGVFVLISASVKRAAIKLSKISNDLRLLSSGPRAGLAEISLPARQAGSSIMPGKVNPVIPELVNQVAFEIMGADVTVSLAAEAGQLQLNAFEPVIAASLFRSIEHLRVAATTLADECIDGITANEETLGQHVAQSIGVVTALSPYLGYEVSGEIAATALRTGTPVVELVRQRNLMDPELLGRLLRPEIIAGGGELPHLTLPPTLSPREL